MPKRFKSAIHWFRRDLRVTDNRALSAAAAHAAQVFPVYILSTWKKDHSWTGAPRQAFLCGCLESLAESLSRLESRLIIRQGSPLDELKKLITETKAEALYTNRATDPFGRHIEDELGRLCQSLDVELHTFKDTLLHEPEEIATGQGTPYRVYTPFCRKWLSLDKPSVASQPAALSSPALASVASLALPSLDTWKLPGTGADLLEPGEQAARQRLDAALAEPLPQYAAHRNTPAGRTTSRLSQDLRFGLLSIREVYARTARAADEARSQTARDSLHTFIKELAWREFYMHLLHHHPEVLDLEFNPKYRNLPWRTDHEAFNQWSQGRTGFPLVDAGMRELLATGFMHNRVRMIVSMFLTKDLRIDWRHGERFFMQHLVDGEIASNNGGWQWSAGTGADAAPYFRIQNPWTQTKRYDPQGVYIKQWVPELAGTPAKHLFTPPSATTPIAPGYPVPIVDHAEERHRTLAFFKQHSG